MSLLNNLIAFNHGITQRNKVDAGFSMASMSDLVFLLLIFFMITSTLVSPNALKLLLPRAVIKPMQNRLPLFQ